MKAILLTLGMIMLCFSDTNLIYPVIGISFFAGAIYLDEQEKKEREKNV